MRCRGAANAASGVVARILELLVEPQLVICGAEAIRCRVQPSTTKANTNINASVATAAAVIQHTCDEAFSKRDFRVSDRRLGDFKEPPLAAAAAGNTLDVKPFPHE